MVEASRQELFRWADQIPAPLWDDLCARPPDQAAEAVGGGWDGKIFKVSMIGIDYFIDPASRKISTRQYDDPVSYQAGIVLLTTLAGSKGVPPSGRMAVPRELPGGRFFFTGAHAVANEALARGFEMDPGGLVDRAEKAGGEIISGADIAIRIPGLPYLPLYALLWRREQDFPARAVIGVDDRAHFHLDLAGIFALTNLLVSRLRGKLRHTNK